MAGVRVQCLLFVFHGRELDVGKPAAFLDQTKVKGFALLHAKDNLTQLHELLACNGFPVMNDDQDHTFLKLIERNTCVEVIELLLEEEVRAEGKAPPSDSSSQKCRAAAQNCSVNIENLDIAFLLSGAGVGHRQKGDLRSVCCAVDELNTKVLERLLSYKADINLRHVKGGTILHLAVKRGHKTLVRLLLSHGADVDSKRFDGSTALHVASSRGLTKIAETLLQHKANPNVATSFGLFVGSTPLHFAVRSRHVAITELLLAHGAQVDAEDFENRTSLLLAVEWGYLEAVEIILNHRLDGIQETTMKALCCAVHTRKIEFSQMVKLRLEHALTASFKNAPNRYDLHDTVFENSRVFLEELACLGTFVSDLSADNFLSLERLYLTTSTGFNKKDILKAFLEYGSDATTRLDWGNGKNDRLKNIALLIKYGARRDALNEFGSSLITIACKDGNADVVGILLRNGLNPYSRSPREEEISLFVATRHGHRAVVKTILEFGVLIEFRNCWGQTALHVAANLNKSEVVNLLLDYGADIHSICNAGKTPLSIAVEAGFTQVVEVLLRFDSRSEFKNSDNQGILRLALNGRSTEIVQTLLNFSFVDMMTNHREALSESGPLIHASYLIMVDLRASSFANCIRLQLTKLKTIVSPSDQEVFIVDPHSRTECLNEISKLKEETLRDTGVSYFDLLVHNINRIALYLRNENVAQILTSDDLENDFPMYGGIIRSQLQKGNKRKELIERGVKLCPYLFSHLSSSQFLSLPFGIPEKILVYLSNKDIGSLTNALVRKNCTVPLSHMQRGRKSKRDKGRRTRRDGQNILGDKNIT